MKRRGEGGGGGGGGGEVGAFWGGRVGFLAKREKRLRISHFTPLRGLLSEKENDRVTCNVQLKNVNRSPFEHLSSS